MTAFWTLMKREYLDHKGGMFWTPLVVSGVISILVAVGAVQVLSHHNGKLNVNIGDEFATGFKDGMKEGTITKPDGTTITRKVDVLPDGTKQTTVTVTDKKGEQKARITVDGEGDTQSNANINMNGVNFGDMKGLAGALNNMPEKERVDGARTYGAMTSSTGAAALLISAFVIPFLLLGSLFDERQDRSILFWKSMPVSDRKTVLSKLLANTVGTVSIAILFGLAVHMITLIITSIVAGRFGFNGIGDLWHLPTIASAWINWMLLAVLYLMWALPVYAWLMLVSAASPRAPFLFAFLIPGGLALIEVATFKTHLVGEHFFARLIGLPLANAAEKMSLNGQNPLNGEVLISKARELLLNNFAQPGLWVGLVIAAAVLYATMEVRKRRTL
jgi:ABC-2 type transport system permease protein